MLTVRLSDCQWDLLSKPRNAATSAVRMGPSIVPAVSCPSNKRTPNEEPWPQAEVSDNGTPNGRCYSRSTVKRLIEYPSAPPMKTSDKK
jgi:hypothetical protein